MDFDPISIGKTVGSVLLVMVPAYFKIKKLIINNLKSLENRVSGVQAMIRANVQQLKNQIVGMDPTTYFTLDLTFETGLTINYPLIPNTVVEIYPGLRMTLIRSNEHETLVVMTCDPNVVVRLPLHRHKSVERIEIMDGSIWNRDQKKLYSRGETWEIPANTLHSGDLDGCIALIHYLPPLSLASQRPVNLEGVDGLFGTFIN